MENLSGRRLSALVDETVHDAILHKLTHAIFQRRTRLGTAALTSLRGRIQRTPRRLATLPVRIVFACILSLGAIVDAHAERVFTSRFTTNDNGDVQIIGNTLFSCTQGTNTPPATCLASVPVSGTGVTDVANLNDNAYTMKPVNTAGGTTSSSSADLSLPTGAQILWAGLYWGADTSAGTGGVAAATPAARNQIKFALPGGAYQSLTATQLDAVTSATNRYSAFIPVTAFVQAGGAGTYRVADIQAGTGADRYAGWSLVIVVRDPAQPLRNLTVFDGLQTISTSATTVNVSVSGFRTPLTGAFTARVGAVAYEGDLGSTGDQFKINGINLSNAVNPTTNVFNSTISRLGANITAKNPNFVNQMGFDADVFDASGILANGATGATLTFTTSSETYYPAVVTFANDVYQPVVDGNVTKTVTDLNGGSVLPGDILQYTIALSNTGNDTATNVVLTDAIPPNTTYVPGTLVVVSGANAGAKTDVAGDDQANFGGGAAVFRLGTGATATAGGTLAINQATSVSFRVTVNAGVAAGTSIANQASIAFNSATLGTAFTSLSDGDPNTGGNQPTTVVVGSTQSRLNIDKDSTPNPVVAGQNLTYTLHVSNSGPSDATNAIVSDPLAATTTFVSASAPAGWTVTAPAVGSSGTVQFSAPTLAVGNYDLVIVTKVVPGTPGGTVIGNTATATSTNDPSGTHTAATNTTVANSGDLSLSKNASATVGQGQQLTYALQLNNPGPDAATGVVVSDPLPIGTTFVSASAPVGWTVTAPAAGAGGTVTFSIGTLPAGAVSFSIVATAAATATIGSTITNIATVSSTSADSNAANNTASAGTLVQNPVPGVAKAFTPASVASGAPSTMRITITNDAAVPIGGIAINDTLPTTPGQMRVSNPATGVTNTCGGTFTAAAGATSVTLAGAGPLAAAASCFVEVNVVATTVGNYVNTTDNVTSTQTPTGPTATASLAIGVLNAPTTTKSFTPASVQLGAAAQMTIAFANPNATPITGAGFLDTYPAGILNSSTTVVASNTCGGVVTAVTGGNSLQLTAATIPATGCSIVVNVVATAIGNAVNTTGPITSTNAQSGAGGTGTLAVTPLGAPGATKSFSPATVNLGGATQMTIALTNPNASPITLTGFTDTYPSGIANASGTVVVSNSCGGSLTANPGDSVLALNGGVIPSSGACSVVVNIVATGAGPQLNNTGPITSGNAQTGSGASGTLTVTPVADLAITKSDGSTAYIPGAPISYTILVTNAGPSGVTGATVVDTPPAAISGVSWSATYAGGASGIAGGSGAINTLVDLPNGSSATFTFSGTVASNATGALSNSASVSVPTGVTDPASGNNTATDNDTSAPIADIQAVKTGTASAGFGAPLTYSIVVTNHGPSDANGTTFGDAVPAGVTSITASCGVPTGGAVCGAVNVAGNNVTSTITALPNGASVTFTINGTAPTSGTSISNSATAQPPAGVTDPTPGNNTGTATTSLLQPQLTLIKAATPNPFTVGQLASYAITLSNGGAGPTSGGITVADTLPAGITLASASGTNWSCTGTTTLSCTFSGSIAAGGSTVLTLNVNVAANAQSANNSATANGGGDGGCPAASRCTGAVTVPVNATADIAVSKSVDVATPNVGDNIVFTVTALNQGPNNATGVAISDALPSGLQFVSALPSQGAYVSGTGLWTVGALANGAQATLQITATVLTPGGLTNTATKTAGDQFDPVSGNNAGSAMLNAQPSADLQVSKRVDNALPNLGTNVTFTVTVHNAGPNDASGVVIDDLLPPGLNYVSSIASQGSYDEGAGVWTLGALVNGADASLSVVATVTLPGDLTNTASVAASNQHDPNPANNSGGVTVNGQSSDLQVIKGVDNANPLRGDSVTFTITATNNGPSAATGVAIIDALPAGLSFVSASASQGSYVDTTGVWTVGSLAATGAAATAMLTIVATVDTDTGFTNTASVSALDQTDPNPANNTGSVVVTPIASADVGIVKSGPATATAGQQATYTLVVTNHGPSPATSVTLDDPTPAGFTFVSAAAPCTGGFPCNLGALANGSSATVTVTFALPSSATAAITNTASASSATQDPASGNNSSTVDTPVARSADIQVQKTGPATVAADGAISYSVVVTNLGPSDANGTVFDDPLPAGIGAISASCGAATAGAVCGAVDVAGNEVSSTIATLPANASVTFTITGAAPPDATTLSNTASATAPVGVTDPTSANNSSTVATNVTAVANLQVSKTGPVTATAGQAVTYTLTVTNAGPSAATNVSLADPTPAGLTYVSATAPCAGGFPCNLGSLASGANVSVSATYTVPPNASGAITNTATATSPTPDPTPGDNSSSVTTAIGAVADLAIVKTAPASVIAGGTISYSIVVSNAGPSDVTAAAFADNVPAGISSIAASCASATGGAVCGPVNIAGNSVTSTITSVPAGGNVTITVSGIAPADPGTLANTATIAPPLGVTDPNAANNSSSVSTSVTASADLSVVKNGPATVASGGSINYTLLIHNAGPSAANGASYSDPVPAAISAISASCSAASGAATCAAPNVAGNLVSGAVPTLPAGGSVTITINGTAPFGTQSLDNTAMLSPPSGVVDPNNRNNRSSVSTAIGAAADIALTKSVDNGAPNVGDTVTFTITANNAGPNDASGVAVTDSLPFGLAFVSASPSAGSYDPSSGVWTIGAIANGDSVTLTLVASVEQPDALTNTVTVSASDQPDPDTSNNSAGASLNAGATADVAVAKSVDHPTPNVGSTITYTITATNSGPNDATGVEIVDNLPAGLTLTSATSSQGSYDSSSGVWIVGAIANGARATLAISATVDAAGAIVNTATITHEDQFDPSAANNQAGTTINGQQADLAMAKSVDDTSPNVGDDITFTVSVHNNGPSQATSVSIEDLLPAGLSFVSATPSQGNYDEVSGVWLVGTLDAAGAGSSATLSVLANVASAGALTNTASVATSDQTDPNGANNSASVSLNGHPLADLGVVKTGPATITPGDTLVYTIVVSNAGPSDATNVVVSDPTPTGLVFVSNSGACATAYPCAIASIANGASATISSTYTVPANYDGANPIVNTASVSSDVPDPNPVGNQGSTNTNVGPGNADLSIVKSGPATVVSGGAISYTLTIGNDGPSPANGANYVDEVPASITAISASCGSEAGGAACATQPNVVGNSVSGNVGSLPSGGSVIVTITGTAAAGPDSLSNTATIAAPAGVTDPDNGNNSSTVNSSVGATSADLVLVKQGPASVTAGSQATYTLQVTNNGPDTAVAVVLDDPTPTGLTFVSASTPCASGFPCALGDLANSASTIVSVTFAIPADASGSIVNTATLTSPTSDPDVGSNSSTVTTPINAAPTSADLSIIKTGPASVAPGTNLTYTLQVANNGPDAAINVVLDDPTPLGVVFVSASAPCAAGFPCNLGSLANGENTLVTVTFTVSAGASGTLANSATVGSDTPDPDSGNNGTTLTIPIVPKSSSADLTISKSGPASVLAGGAVVYTIVVGNNGPDTATNVIVTDTTPPGLLFVGNSGACTGAYPCSLGTLANGASATISSTYSVPLGYAGPTPLVNTAGVGSDTPDPNGDNNVGVANTTVTQPAQSADLSVVKTGPASAAPGTNLTYTLQVANSGPDTATNVVLNDPTPAGLVFVGNSGACATAYPCALGTLANGASATITSTYAVPAGYMGANPLVNTAGVSSDTPDPNGNDNVGSATTTVVPVAASADLSILKSGPAMAMAGDTVTYTLVVTNNGPDAVSDAVVDDPTPLGLDLVSASAPCSGGFPCIVALSNGDQVTIATTYRIGADRSGDIVNVASVASPSVRDPTPNNNSGTATTLVSGGGSVSSVAVPIDSRWMLALAALLMMLAGALGVRIRGQ
ncbi:MAG: hypothetical protein ABI843_11070 [Dokdonella sp.]